VIDWRMHLTSDPKICGGQLCAHARRVLATVILDNLAEGLGHEEILPASRIFEPIHIDAAVAYAAELAHEESLLPLARRLPPSSTSVTSPRWCAALDCLRVPSNTICAELQ